MMVELLAARGAGGKAGDRIDVPLAEAESLFRKGKARPVRAIAKPEKAVRKRKPEHADARNRSDKSAV